MGPRLAVALPRSLSLGVAVAAVDRAFVVAFVDIPGAAVRVPPSCNKKKEQKDFRPK